MDNFNATSTAYVGLWQSIAEGNPELAPTVQAMQTQRAQAEQNRINEADLKATPLPDSFLRDAVSVCIYQKSQEACTVPVPFENLSGKVVFMEDILKDSSGGIRDDSRQFLES